MRKPNLSVYIIIHIYNLSAPLNQRDELVRIDKAAVRLLSMVEFELTESIYLDNTEQALELIKGLHKMGIKVSMDDFGSGYSSLNLLSSVWKNRNPAASGSPLLSGNRSAPASPHLHTGR